jgi:hypothetical protein
MFQTLDFTFFECYVGINHEGTKGHPKKIKIMKDINDELAFSSSRVVLEVNVGGGGIL